MKRISFKNSKRSRRVALLAGVFFAATALLGGTALAATVTLNGGNLSISTPVIGDFSDVNLNGNAQTTDASLGTFDVTDARGTGAGWNVTVQSTQFASASHTLPTGSISLSEPTVAKKYASSNTVPTIVGGPYSINQYSGSSPVAVKIASAAVDAGMGAYTFSPSTMTLSVGADAYAGVYTSTVTVSVVTGP